MRLRIRYRLSRGNKSVEAGEGRENVFDMEAVEIGSVCLYEEPVRVCRDDLVTKRMEGYDA